MPGTPPPTPLITSALGLGLEAFVAVRASMQAGIADARAAFELTLGAPSPDWGFLVLAGLEPLVDALERLRLRVDELEWLESVGALDARSRRKLAEAKFACDIDAPPEGTIVFPGEAVLTVEGAYWQAQIVGGLVLGAIAEASLVATKFARMRIASGGADVIEQGAASAHRLGGVPTLARAAYVGGARATTSALAARRYRIPVVATQPMQLDAAVGSEDRAIRVWLASCEGDCVLRLDPARFGVVLPRLVANVRDRLDLGDRRISIELPAGDRASLAMAVSRAFTAAGLKTPPIIVSGDVDERLALELRDLAPAVQEIAVSADAVPGSSLARYDLVAIEDGGSWSPRLRFGGDASSSSDPGRKLLVRYSDPNGRPVVDVSHAPSERLQRASGGKYVDRATGLTAKLAAATGNPLRASVMRAGKRSSTPEAPELLRERAARGVAALGEGIRRIVGPTRYPVGVTSTLAALKADMIAKANDA